MKAKKNGIKIYSEDSEYVFVLSKNKKDKVWDFGVLGYKDQTYLTRVENIAEFEIKPCTDIEKIMHEIPDTWFEISTIEGQEVIYEPCESAPGGITITTKTIDFWGGSDPYKIRSMTKLNNEVTIIYERHDLSESKIIFKEWNETILSIKIEDKNAVKHVSKEAKGNYPIIEEEC